MTPAQDRLIINVEETKTKNINKIQDLAQKIYKILPHTPIIAIGHNFKFELNKNEKFSIPIKHENKKLHSVLKKLKLVEPEENIMKFQALHLSDPKAILNVTLQDMNKQKTLELNYHYQIEGNKLSVGDVLSQFVSNFKHSQEVTKVVITK